MLEVRDITKVYNPGTVTEQRLFDHFSLTVEEGQFVSIVGSNGSGKTSLLNIICGSIPIEGGDVLVGGKSIARQKDYQRYASMGRVYQNPAAGTAPNLTMLENLSLADNKGRSFGLSRGVNRRRVDFYRQQLQSLGLDVRVLKDNGEEVEMSENIDYADTDLDLRSIIEGDRRYDEKEESFGSYGFQKQEFRDGELVDSEDDDYIDGPEEEDGYIDDDYSEKDN